MNLRKAAFSLQATLLACLNFREHSHDVLCLHCKVLRFVFVKLVFYFCMQMWRGETVRGCQHIAGSEQTAHERRQKSIWICFMLMLVGTCQFWSVTNYTRQSCTHTYSLTHTHIHWILSLSLFMRMNVNFYECETDLKLTLCCSDLVREKAISLSFILYNWCKQLQKLIISFGCLDNCHFWQLPGHTQSLIYTHI